MRGAFEGPPLLHPPNHSIGGVPVFWKDVITGLYICTTFKQTLNADVNGVANISNPIFPSPLKGDRDNWVMAPPLIVSLRNG